MNIENKNMNISSKKINIIDKLIYINDANRQSIKFKRDHFKIYISKENKIFWVDSSMNFREAEKIRDSLEEEIKINCINKNYDIDNTYTDTDYTSTDYIDTSYISTDYIVYITYSGNDPYFFYLNE